MNEIAHYLSPQDIILHLDVADKLALFDAIGRHLEQTHKLPYKWIVPSLSRREQDGCTGIGKGVAIPHARIDGLLRTLAVYVRLASPIPFDAPDGKPVSDVLVLLVPNPANIVHLKILSEISQLFSDQGFRDALHKSVSRHEVIQLFSAWRLGKT